MVAGAPSARAPRWLRLGVPSITVWAAGGAGGICLVALLAVAVPLAIGGNLDGPVLRALVLGGIVTATAAVTVGLSARELGRAISALGVEAAALPDAVGTPGTPRPAPRGLSVAAIAELASLARGLDALRLRGQIATEVARRHQHSAQTAGVGMFALLSGLVQAEEAARGQLAAELHDTVAQSLQLACSLLGGSVGVAEAAQAAELVNEAEEQVRAVMARTRPPMLREGNLADAVVAMATDLQQRYGLTVSLSWPAQASPLPLATAVIVYRFFQETLLNVVKHADVDQASAGLVFDATGMVARVRDAGSGFQPLTLAGEGGRHVGLGLLRERARLAGGTLRIESDPGAGTLVELRLPRLGSVLADSADTAVAGVPATNRPVDGPE